MEKEIDKKTIVYESSYTIFNVFENAQPFLSEERVIYCGKE